MSELERIIRSISRDVAREEIRAAAPTTDLISVRDYAARRSISPSTVRKAISEARLPFVRIGRLVRVRPDAEIKSKTRDVVHSGRVRLGIVK